MRHWITSFQLVEHGSSLAPFSETAQAIPAKNQAGADICSRRRCQASISYITAAAVSSIERRVTSITGQPRLVHRRRDHSSSLLTASYAT